MRGRSLQETTDDYLLERKKRGFVPVDTHRCVLRQLQRAAFERLSREPLAVEITREDLDAVLDAQRERGLSLTTRFDTAVVLSVFCRRLVRKGILLLDPARDLSVKRPPLPLLFVPSRDEVRRLLDLATPEAALLRAGLHPTSARGDEDLSQRERIVAEALRERAVLELLYGSGLRIGEVKALNVSDLNLAERTLLIRQGKGKKDRVVPITRGAALWLSRYLSQAREALVTQKTSKAPRPIVPRREALFVTMAGSRLSNGWRRFSLAPLFSLAGFPRGAGAHRLRHACAVHLLESGVSIVFIARLLGHENIETTADYLRLSTASLRKALLLAHPRERIASG